MSAPARLIMSAAHPARTRPGAIPERWAPGRVCWLPRTLKVLIRSEKGFGSAASLARASTAPASFSACSRCFLVCAAPPGDGLLVGTSVTDSASAIAFSSSAEAAACSASFGSRSEDWARPSQTAVGRRIKAAPSTMT